MWNGWKQLNGKMLGGIAAAAGFVDLNPKPLEVGCKKTLGMRALE